MRENTAIKEQLDMRAQGGDKSKRVPVTDWQKLETAWLRGSLRTGGGNGSWGVQWAGDTVKTVEKVEEEEEDDDNAGGG